MSRRRTSSSPAALTAGACLLAGIAAASTLLPRRGPKRQIVVITGGGGGLGTALARRWAREDARLVLNGRDPAPLDHARQTLLSEGAVLDPDHILPVAADLSDPAEAERLIQTALEHFERIDVLINAAGIIEVGPIEDQPIDAFHRAMAANFFAALHTTLAALPHLLRQSGRPEARFRASIVNISSKGGKLAVPHMLPYVASKFALTGFSEGLHSELRAKGIRVTTVCPGLMRTGSEVRAQFVGDAEKEKRWFDLGATTPVIAASVKHAADRIYNATAAGRAEITITPQAWLAARVVGVAPALSSMVGSLANEVILPAPVPAQREP